MNTAGLGDLRDGALVTLLAMNGQRISEALNADIDDLSTERGHRTLAIVRKGGKHVTAPRTGRALDLYVGERTMGTPDITLPFATSAARLLSGIVAWFRAEASGRRVVIARP